MKTGQPSCPSCRTQMDEGFMLDRAHHNSPSQAEWAKGAPELSGWRQLKLKGRERIPVTTYRCSRCGLLQSYARAIVAVLLVALALGGCESSSDDDSGSTPTLVSGSIAADGTWSGTVRLTANADILADVDIHVAAGTKFEAAQGAILRVYGSLWIDGSAAHSVSMEPLSGATSWAGITVEAGGLAELRHVTGSKVDVLLFSKAGALDCIVDTAQFSDLGRAIDAASVVMITNANFSDLENGAVMVRTGGAVTITDSVIWGTSGDLVVVQGGSLTMSYCDIGSTTSSQHGDLFLSDPNAIDITYCNIVGAVYGVFIGGSNQAVVQYSNFLQNENDVGDLGSNTAVDMRYNYWDGGPPSLGAAYDFNSPAASPIATAGPRG